MPYVWINKEGKLYGLTIEATTLTDNSIHTQLLPCLCTVHQTDVNNNEYVTIETMWVHAELKINGLSVQLGSHLNPWSNVASS